MKNTPIRVSHDSKPYVVRRVKLQGMTYPVVNATMTTLLRLFQPVVSGPSQYGVQYGRSFYCNTCGKRVSAGHAFYDELGEGASCGMH